MKTITLTQGYEAIVDDEDFDRLSGFKWQVLVNPKGQTIYAQRTDKNRKHVLMHREILQLTDRKIHIDHRNHDGLDNRIRNLRICSLTQNAQNRRKPRFYKGLPTKSKFKGVRAINDIKRKAKWQAIIQYNGKRINIGRFLTEGEARNAYNLKAKELFGEFAFTN